MMSKEYIGNRGIGSLTIPREYNGMQVVLQDGDYRDPYTGPTIVIINDADTRNAPDAPQLIVERCGTSAILAVYGKAMRSTRNYNLKERSTRRTYVDTRKSFARLRFRLALRRTRNLLVSS